MTDFICQADGHYLSACKDLPKYPGSRYCVLHHPDEEKNKEDFLEAKESKLERKDYDFSGTIFPEGTSDFQEFEFDANASFYEAVFNREANFSRARFSGSRTIFTGAEFNGTETSFIGAKFSGGETAFSGAEFSSEKTSFSGAEFSSEMTYFERAKFSGKETDFWRAQFKHWRTNFEGAQFGAEKTSFVAAEFGSKKTDFSVVQFGSENILFMGVQFSGMADFSEAQFSGQTDFYDATLKDSTFEHATFKRGANFTKAKFTGTRKPTTDFRRATFGEELYFREAEFNGYTDFYRTNFLDAVKFVGSEKGKDKNAILTFALDGRVSFTRARIEKSELFSFDAVVLRPSWFVGVDARKFDFTDVRWYGMPGGPKGAIDEEIDALRNADVDSPHTLLSQACRRLSANAEDNREYPLANEFHYWSMDALRKGRWSYFKGLTLKDLLEKATWREIGQHFGLITTLYWALSGYGVRAARALWVLIGICAAFAALYMVFGPPKLQDLGQAVVYSLGAVARLNPEPRPTEPGLFQFLVIVEGLLGPLQIALLALAVRRRVMR